MAENYVLFTDSACDILPEKLEEWNVRMIPLAFLFTDTGKEQKDHEEPIGEFYKAMRAGRVAKTSCVNEDAFEKAFIPVLEEGPAKTARKRRRSWRRNIRNGRSG